MKEKLAIVGLVIVYVIGLVMGGLSIKQLIQEPFSWVWVVSGIVGLGMAVYSRVMLSK